MVDIVSKFQITHAVVDAFTKHYSGSPFAIPSVSFGQDLQNAYNVEIKDHTNTYCLKLVISKWSGSIVFLTTEGIGVSGLFLDTVIKAFDSLRKKGGQ